MKKYISLLLFLIIIFKSSVFALETNMWEYVYYNDIPLNVEQQMYLYNICKYYNFEYELALGVIQLESNFDSTCITYNKKANGEIISEDRGLFQINSLYEEWYAKLAQLEEWDVFDYKDNIRMGLAGLAFYKEYWENQNIDKDKLDLYMLNSYNLGIEGFKEYMRYNNTISRTYDRLIYEHKNKIKNYDVD